MAGAEKKPLHVCFVTPKAYPIFNPAIESVFGGAEVDVYFLATELAKDQDVQVSCIVADYGQPQTEQREGVQLIRSLQFQQNPLTGAIKIWQALRRADADIYFMKTASAGVPLVNRFCRRHNRRFIYRTAHSDETDGTYVKQHRLVGKLFIRALKQAALVFAQTQADAERLQQRYQVRSVVLPNGHRIPDLPGQPRESILWVGRTADFKKPEKFLDLARRFPEEHFTFICQKATHDRDYDRLIAQAAQINNLTHLPRVPFNRIDDYFLRAKILVNTSDAEGFPNTFIQAARCACPILSLTVNPDDFLNRHHCGRCANGDTQRFTDLFQNLLNPQTAQSLGQNARHYVKKHHDIQRIAQSYIDLFREIL